MKAHCSMACLAGGDPCFWLNLAKQKKFKEAWLEIVEMNPLPAVIGKVCPHPCEDACKRVLLDEPISINALEGYLGEMALENGWNLQILANETKPFKVAVVGSGPAGLSCAYQLVRRGYQVDICERSHVLGGMLSTGIPDFRLPKPFLEKEIDNIISLGVGVFKGFSVDENFLSEYLVSKYNAVFLAAGLQKPKRLNIPGEDFPEVIRGLDFMREVNLGGNVSLGKKVLVIGGGNTAIDVARTARKLGSQVAIFSLESEELMPAFDTEIAHAKSEGIELRGMVMPFRILRSLGKQLAEFRKVEIKGANQFSPILGTNFQEEFDTLIVAIGEEKEASFAKGYREIFTVDDISSVAGAIKAGREAAEKIVFRLESKNQNNIFIPSSNPDFYLTPQNRIALDEEAGRCLGCGFEIEGLTEVLVDEDRCKGCALCVDACPYQILEMANRFNSQSYEPAAAKEPKKCRGCDWCDLVCPDAAITIKREV